MCSSWWGSVWPCWEACCSWRNAPGGRACPGDIVYHRGGLTVFLPLGTSVLLSLLLTLILMLLRKP
ncbi:MAG TPA: DUF2905 family protein [Candidatus Polarisedimenticolaceae bacterium]|nr:DUF2905 family protein [Candidatus Polarisedimenticolaceae bacterium]